MARRALNPITVATIIVILYMTMPIVSVFISTYISTYAYMLMTMFLTGFILLAGGFGRLNSFLYTLLPFIIYVGFTVFLRTDSFVLWGYQSILFLLPVILGYYYIYYRENTLSLFGVVIVTAVVITIITTIIGLIRFPYAARMLATITNSDDPQNIKYNWHNIGSYTFVYTAVLLYPILILAHKMKRINIIAFSIGVILVFSLVILSEYTTALLLITITSVLYFSGKHLTSRQLLIFGIVIFIALFVFWDFFKNFLLWLSDIIESETVTERLTALAGGYEGLENSESNRIELYQTSINSFLKSPFFGNIFSRSSSAGGHSFILDMLSDYGILGGTIVILMYKNIYRYFFKPYVNSEGYGYVLWAFIQAIILSTVNTGMWLIFLAFFTPILLHLIYHKDCEEYYENSLDG